MNQALLILSGPIAAGKSTVAKFLREKHGFLRVSSSQFLTELAKSRCQAPTRKVLQDLGDMLDIETDYTWLVDDVVFPQMAANPARDWFVDAIRKRQQADKFKARLPSTCHIHFTASDATLKSRFDARLSASGVSSHEPSTYEKTIKHPNEIAARSLGLIADLIIDLDQVDSEEAAEIAAHTCRGKSNA